MGSFYGSVHLRTDDISSVKEILEDLRRKKKINFFLSPPLRGWISVYPAGYGQDEIISKSIARKIKCPLFHLISHDDDVFYYHFYRDGKLLDRYSSCPEYFGELPEKDKKKFRGNPEFYKDLLCDKGDFEKLKDILVLPSHSPFPGQEKLLLFAEILHIPNISTAYEYMADGETDDIEEWEKFVHIPDLSRINKKKRKADEKIIEEKKLLMDNGLLLFESSVTDKFFVRPVWCEDPSGKGFLVCWNRGNMSNTCQIENYHAPWSAAPFPSGINIQDSANIFKLSPSGRYLATGNAFGNWNVQIWNMEQKKAVAEIKHTSAVTWVDFSRDEKTVYSRSSYEVIITSVENFSPVNCFTLSPGGNKGAVHPSEEIILLEQQDKLLLIDLRTGKQLKTLYVGGKKDFTEIFNFFIPKLEEEFNKKGVKFPDKLLSNRVHSNEYLFCMDFSRDGKMLFLGTDNGVRVFNWHDLMTAIEETPAPLFSYPDGPVTSGEPRFYVYTLLFDEMKNTLIFGAGEGNIGFIDLTTGKSGILLAIPASPPLLNIGLSRDRSVLCSSFR
ncbi:MAG: hypothetical protein ABRQ37_03935, partial [Candidatus Eremiobacterota bacterium]